LDCNTPVFMPIYAQDILKGDARTLGFLLSSAGVGAVIGALQFAARTHYRGLARWIAWTSTTCAVGLIVFFTRKDSGIVHGGALCGGIRGDFADGGDNTLIQNRVPDELRSRVMAVYATMFMGVQRLGVGRGWDGETYPRAEYAGGVWVAGAGGERDFYFSRGDEARRNANSGRQIK